MTPVSQWLVSLPADACAHADSALPATQASIRDQMLAAFAGGAGSVVLARRGADFPPDFFARALAFAQQDPRIATVSFLTAAADGAYPLALPGCLDAAAATQRLRSALPDSGAVPVAAPGGTAILVSRSAAAAAELTADSGEDAWLRAFAATCARRGLAHVLDAATIADGESSGAAVGGGPGKSAAALLALSDHDTFTRSSPVAAALACAEAKLHGLRVVVDASSLGPALSGSQIHTMELLAALSRSDSIRSLGIALGPDGLPGYAAHLAALPKAELVTCAALDLSAFGNPDIIHRPIQPDLGTAIPWAAWSQQASRTVITILDLIAYGIGAYHPSPSQWLDYRASLADAVASADAVVTISADVARTITAARLDVAPSRLHPIDIGIDHLGETSDALEPPPGSEALTGDFAFVLGNGFAHKNRDLAIRTVTELRRRGRSVQLVIAGAGATAPRGKAEHRAVEDADPASVIWLGEVTDAERNWLLSKACVLLYPTSAEGFGLVPHEAAALGTPPVYVAFGPLADLLPRNGGEAASWDPGDFADAVERVAFDPAAAEQACALIRASGAPLTWDATADALTAVYLQVLSEPKRIPAPAPPASPASRSRWRRR